MGSEMCIRDRFRLVHFNGRNTAAGFHTVTAAMALKKRIGILTMQTYRLVLFLQHKRRGCEAIDGDIQGLKCRAQSCVFVHVCAERLPQFRPFFCLYECRSVAETRTHATSTCTPLITITLQLQSCSSLNSLREDFRVFSVVVLALLCGILVLAPQAHAVPHCCPLVSEFAGHTVNAELFMRLFGRLQSRCKGLPRCLFLRI